MNNAATALSAMFGPEAAPVPAPNRDREIWIGLPKGGKTLGGSDEEFLLKAGFQTADKIERVDHYRLVDGPDFKDVGVRVFEMKPGDAVANIADGMLDAAIAGGDVFQEFTYASRNIKGQMQPVRIGNLDLAPCALAVAVRSDDVAQSPADLNGRTIVTKYPSSVENWAKKNKISFAKIIERNGGIENYGLLIGGAIIADMVESGRSLVANDWRVLGMSEEMTGEIADGRTKFSSLSMDEMTGISGVIVASRALVARTPKPMGDAKEKAFATLMDRFKDASSSMNREPQFWSLNFMKRRRRVDTRVGEIGHGFRHL